MKGYMSERWLIFQYIRVPISLLSWEMWDNNGISFHPSNWPEVMTISKWAVDPQHIHPLQLEEFKTSIFKAEVPSTSSCPESWPPPSLPPPKVKMVPIQLGDFSTLWWCGNKKHSVETILQSLNFNLLPCLVISRDAGQLPISHIGGTDRHFIAYCVLCFK